MDRIPLLLTTILLALSVSAQDRPNIVLIMADDLGYGDLSCYGSERIRTPHIDALAERGVRFTDYHSNGAVCSPTRAALMTGRYPQRTGVEGVITAARHREVGLPLAEYTMAEMLRDAGYATALFGKWHLGYDVANFGPLRQGFDTFEGFVSGNVDYFNKIDQEGHKDWWIGDELEHIDGYVTDLINDRAAQWIGAQQQEDPDKPFFLYLAHGAPHYPMQGPGDEGFRGVGRRVREMPEDVAGTYRAMIESMDTGIGRVVAALVEHGIAENTLVIFCSDNGQASRYTGSAGPLRGQKGTVYEGGHRVPMVWYWPAVMTESKVSDSMVLGMDLMPTFATLAGVELPAEIVLDGKDLVNTSDSQLRTRRAHWVHDNQHAMREGPWKLVIRGENAPELYSLADDLGETTDLAGQQPERVARMVAAHQQWLTRTREGVVPVSGSR
ncbi:MAG: sulfatase [Planctomycetota bacterium]